jgi:hypothetical protein
MGAADTTLTAAATLPPAALATWRARGLEVVVHRGRCTIRGRRWGKAVWR